MTSAPPAPRQWYDASWLGKFMEAQDIIARVTPRRLNEFVRSFDVLRAPPDFKQRCIRGFLNEERLAGIRREIAAIPIDRLEPDEIKTFGRMIVRRWPAFTALQAELTEQVSELAGEPIEPSYNFLSLYSHLGHCRPHLDAPSAKWTLDLCIDQNEPWPIHFSRAVAWPETPAALRQPSVGELLANPGLRFTTETLLPGDAVLFSGTNQWHYRDAMPEALGRRFCDLLFLHYVPRGTLELVQPRNWARLFDVPELAEMSEVELVY